MKKLHQQHGHDDPTWIEGSIWKIDES